MNPSGLSSSNVPPFVATASARQILFEFKTSCGSAAVAESIPAEDYETWIGCFDGKAADHRYYEIVHHSLADQFGHYYLLLKDNEGCTRAIQPFLIVSQDLVLGTPVFIRKPINWIRRVCPEFLKLRMLMVGCSAGEGDLAAETKSGKVDWTIEGLRQSLKPVARKLKAMLIVFKDFPKAYRRALDALRSSGFTRIPSMPATRLDLDFEDFESFLTKRVSYSMRKNLRRKFRKAETSLAIRWEVVTDVSPFVDEIYPLYRQTLERSELRFEELSKTYFCELSRRMPDRARFFIWRQGVRIVAFASALVHDGVLRDNYIGLDYSIALDRHLYFVTWRDTIIWALENGIHTYHSAPLNYDPKYHFRMELEPLDLYVLSARAWLNPIFRLVLPLLEPTRYDRTIKKFANAGDLW
jgi:Acetyltransferase (GNAT) domain